MMRKQLLGALLLALTFALSACAPQQPSAAQPVPSLSMEQTTSTGLSPYLQVTLTPRWHAQQQQWFSDLVMQNISQQTLDGIRISAPGTNSTVPVLQPQAVFSAVGIGLKDGQDLVIEVSYAVDGMPQHGKLAYRITEKKRKQGALRHLVFVCRAYELKKPIDVNFFL